MNETQDEPGRYLSKEEYESMIQNQDFVERKPCEVTMVTESDAARQVWDTIFNQIQKSGEPIRKSIIDNVDSWASKPIQVLAILNHIDDKDIKAVALLSSNSETVSSGYFIELIITLTPVMEQPYVEMLLKTLKEIVSQAGNSLIIPPRYREYDSALTCANNETKADGALSQPQETV